MDPVLVTFFVVVGLSAAIFLVVFFFYSTPIGLGIVGEHRVKRLLKKHASIEEPYFNNVIIVDDKGHSHQIDHILVRRDGVHVIETKCWRGKLYGSDKMEKWEQWYTKTTDKYGRKIKSRRVHGKKLNPVKQNAAHVYALKQVLGDDVPYFNDVIIANRKPHDGITSQHVYNLSEYGAMCKTEANPSISFAKVDKLGEAIKGIQEGQGSNREHVKNVKQLLSDVDAGVCPRCGGTLVLRKGKSGKEFYGCSNYPNCRFIKNIDESK